MGRIIGAFCLSLASLTLNGATFDIGDFVLLPNTRDQTIEIHVHGGDLIQGEDLYFQIGDGGYLEGINAGHDSRPVLTGIDVVTGTFYGDNYVEPVYGLGALMGSASVVTASETVAAEGLLATLTIDTTGLFAGSSEFAIPFSMYFAKDLPDTSILIFGELGEPTVNNVLTGNLDGRLIIPAVPSISAADVPEPATWLLFLIGGLCLAARRRLS